MLVNTVPRSRLTPRVGYSDHLTVAATPDGADVVHLAIDHPGPAPLTVCNQVASFQPPERLFHDSGCFLCASIALSNGYTAAREGQRATVNLRRWWARKWLTSRDKQLS